MAGEAVVTQLFHGDDRVALLADRATASEVRRAFEAVADSTVIEHFERFIEVDAEVVFALDLLVHLRRENLEGVIRSNPLLTEGPADEIAEAYQKHIAEALDLWRKATRLCAAASERLT